MIFIVIFLWLVIEYRMWESILSPSPGIRPHNHRLWWDGTVVEPGGTAGQAVVSTEALTAAAEGYQWASLVVLPLLQALLLLEGRRKQKWAPTGNTWARWLKVRRQNIFSKIIYLFKFTQNCRVAVFLSPPGIFRDRKPRHHLYRSLMENIITRSWW